MASETLVYVTCKSKKEAVTIAKKLLAQRLVACVNIFPKVESLYRWKSKIQRASETVLISKTKRSNFTAICRVIKEAHSYSVPPIIEINPSRMEAQFAKWIQNETSL